MERMPRVPSLGVTGRPATQKDSSGFCPRAEGGRERTGLLSQGRGLFSRSALVEVLAGGHGGMPPGGQGPRPEGSPDTEMRGSREKREAVEEEIPHRAGLKCVWHPSRPRQGKGRRGSKKRPRTHNEAKPRGPPSPRCQGPTETEKPECVPPSSELAPSLEGSGPGAHCPSAYLSEGGL